MANAIVAGEWGVGGGEGEKGFGVEVMEEMIVRAWSARDKEGGGLVVVVS